MSTPTSSVFTFKAACIQLSSGADMDANLYKTRELVIAAHKAGAQFVALPENVALMEENGEKLRSKSFYSHNHPALAYLSSLARELNIYLLVGSLAVKVEGSDKLANRSFLLNSAGQAVAHYDKIHLFDAQPIGDRAYQESQRFIAGERATLALTPWGALGMTVCYDVRFPYLYRALAKEGARFISIPAAFTRVTGIAHWHVLVVARAIETGCYIFAPGQTGTHPGNRETFGHSLIVSPWGEILADGGRKEGFIIADIDADLPRRIRNSLPSLSHDRQFFVHQMK